MLTTHHTDVHVATAALHCKACRDHPAIVQLVTTVVERVFAVECAINEDVDHDVDHDDHDDVDHDDHDGVDRVDQDGVDHGGPAHRSIAATHNHDKDAWCLLWEWLVAQGHSAWAVEQVHVSLCAAVQQTLVGLSMEQRIAHDEDVQV